MNSNKVIDNVKHIFWEIYLQILSTRLFGKGVSRKLKSITIIHSATTETVRLPEDNNGVSSFLKIKKFYLTDDVELYAFFR